MQSFGGIEYLFAGKKKGRGLIPARLLPCFLYSQLVFLTHRIQRLILTNILAGLHLSLSTGAILKFWTTTTTPKNS